MSPPPAGVVGIPSPGRDLVCGLVAHSNSAARFVGYKTLYPNDIHLNIVYIR